jgi:hypothetical protein
VQLAQLKILSPLLTLKIDLKQKFPPPHKWRSLNHHFSNWLNYKFFLHFSL